MDQIKRKKALRRDWKKVGYLIFAPSKDFGEKGPSGGRVGAT